MHRKLRLKWLLLLTLGLFSVLASCSNPIGANLFPFSPEEVHITFSHESGSYQEPLTVEITGASTGTIFYALKPDASAGSSLQYFAYSDPIIVGESGSLYAYIQLGMDQTVVFSQHYIISQAGEPKPSVTATTASFPFSLSLHSQTPGTTIYYSTDGNVPDESSSLYTGTIHVDKTMTVKARAYREDMQPSTVFSASYTINIDNKIADLAMTGFPVIEQVGIPQVLAVSGNVLYSDFSSRGIEVFDISSGTFRKKGMIADDLYIRDMVISGTNLIITAESPYDSITASYPRFIQVYDINDPLYPSFTASVDIDYLPIAIAVYGNTVSVSEYNSSNIYTYTLSGLTPAGQYSVSSTSTAVVNDLLYQNGYLFAALQVPSPDNAKSGLYKAAVSDYLFSKEPIYEKSLETTEQSHPETPVSITEVEDYISVYNSADSRAYFYFWNSDGSKLLQKAYENMNQFSYDPVSRKLLFPTYYKDYLVNEGDDLKEIYPVYSDNTSYPQGVTYSGNFAANEKYMVSSFVNNSGYILQTLSSTSLNPLYQKWYPSDNPYGVISNGDLLYYASEESPLRILSSSDYSTVYTFPDEDIRSMDNFAFSGNTMVITTFDLGTISIYDNSVPESPVLLTRIQIPSNFGAVWNPRIIGSRLYVSHGYTDPASMSVYDISDVENPLFLTNMLSSHNLWSPVIRDNILYYTYENEGLYIYDIEDIENPVLLNSDTLASELNDGGNVNRPFGFSMDYPYLYINDGGYGIKVVDVSDSANPVIVDDTIATRTTSSYIVDDYLFALGSSTTVTSGTGLRIYDISNRQSPVFVKEITSASGVTVSNLTLAFANNKIIGSDYNVGLVVFE